MYRGHTGTCKPFRKENKQERERQKNGVFCLERPKLEAIGSVNDTAASRDILIRLVLSWRGRWQVGNCRTRRSKRLTGWGIRIGSSGRVTSRRQLLRRWHWDNVPPVASELARWGCYDVGAQGWLAHPRGQTLHDQVDTQAVGDTETAVSGLHGDWHGWCFGDPLSADPRHAGRSDRLDATVGCVGERGKSDCSWRFIRSWAGLLPFSKGVLRYASSARCQSVP